MKPGEWSQEGQFQLAGYRVDPAALRVSAAGVENRLEAKAMQVLLYLSEHAGRVVPRAELEARLWPGRIVTEDAVTNAIAKLRKALGDDARHPRVIETVPKRGYRLIAEVAPLPEALGRSGRGGSDSAYRPRPGVASWALALLSLLLVLGAGWWWLARTGPPPAKPAVAVLPFANLGPSPEQDYFANGITADLITDLSKLSGLLVIAPNSVFAYRDAEAGPGEISAELAVDYLVTGSVQRSGERLRVNVRLIEAPVEHALWGERYDVDIQQLFEVQDRIAAAVVSALEVELAPGERERLARRSTASIAAYDHYLKGFEEHGRRSKEQNRSAKWEFERAIALDPGFARAYAGLAMVHSREAIDGWTETPADSLEEAAALAEQAARLDPGLPQVHFVAGQVGLFQRRHLAAIEAAETAIAIDPNYADAYALSAWILSYAGRPDQAMARLQQAMRLNPRPPASYLEVLGEIQFVQGRYGESAATFQRVLSINPEYDRARMWLAAALAHAGDTEGAEWEAAELQVARPDFSLGRLAYAFPFKDARKLEWLAHGLRKAGLPK